MSRTMRKRWNYDLATDTTSMLVVHDASCRPGCFICGKQAKRAQRRRDRHGKRAAIESDVQA